MRILHRYIASSFITTFLMALLVLTFVMSIALIFEAAQLIARGLSMYKAVYFFLGNIPGALSYIIPIAALVATILVFGSLSADSEIIAMRACGISLSQIMLTPVLISTLLSVLCLFLNNDVSPESAYIRLSSRKDLKASDIKAFIEPGRFVEFDNRSVYVGAIKDNKLDDLRIMETKDDGSTREIRAKSAFIITTNETTSLDMRDVTIDPIQTGKLGVGKADRVVYPLTYYDNGGGSTAPRKRRIKDEHTWVLMKNIVIASKYPSAAEKSAVYISRAKMKITSRISLASACFCFVIVAVPLGIKQQRRESSIGVGICLAVAGAFYLFNIAGDSLAKTPAYHAHHMAWIPIIACIIISAISTSRNN